MGTWPSLPLSGAVCDGQVIWVRLSGERRALAEARAAIALDQAPEAGFWEAVREQRRQEARVPVVYWVELLR